MTLTPERFAAVRALFEAALAEPPDGREAFFASVPHDPAVVAEARALLAAHEATGGTFSRPVEEHLGQAPPGEGRSLLGRTLGAYRVIREIGHGGMGTVYEAARSDEQFTKRVAIKTLRTLDGSAGTEMQSRFRRERQIQATLTHPNIAALLDAGVTDDGIPYIVLEFVDGLPIDQYCDSRRLGLPARLDLFRQVLRAVQHAHRQLVVHRDLKPSNILVTGDGTVKLLDFGIAKLLGDETADHTATGGFRAFTIAYASPEQIRGDPVSTATDLYSLGVVLYRLIAGRHPFDLDLASPAAAWSTICEVTPPPPSAVATDAAAHAAGLADADRLTHALRGELDAIALMALRKEPDRRYPTADALNEDLQNHLRGRPVGARPDTAGYRFRKLVRRNRLATAAVVVAVLALVTGSGVAVWQARVARRQAAFAETQRRTAEGVASFLQSIFASADPSYAGGGLGAQATIGAAIDLAAGRIDTDLASQPAVGEALHRQVVSIYTAIHRIPEGKVHAHRVLAMQRARGAPGPEIARTLRDLAALHRQAGETDSTAAALDEAYRLIESAGAPETEDFAILLNEIALLAWRRGDYADAESRLDRALRIAERVGSNDRLLGIGLSNLGVMREALGNIQGAEAALRKSEFHHARAAGGETFERGSNLNNLAVNLANRGSFEEAAAVLREAEAVWNRTVGPTHPTHGLGRFNRARIELGLGRPADALASVAEGQALLGDLAPDHIDRTRGDVVQASALLALGRLAEAERRGRRALGIRLAALPPTDVRIAEVEEVLGRILLASGRAQEGREHLSRSTVKFRTAFGADHPRTRESQRALDSAGPGRP